jgi:transcriptional regulator with XRE-family HTH domain
MSQPPTARTQLAEKLRDLRLSSELGGLTQRQLADALGTSTPLISSWESAAAVPPDHRLRAYGRFFATRRSVADGRPQLLAEDDLRDDEASRMEALIEELFRLRNLEDSEQASPETGALGGRFWYFPDRQPITILCNPLSQRQLGLLPDGRLAPDAAPLSAYSRPSHPNYIESVRIGDIDALIELVGHIRAENPTAEVRWTTFDDIRKEELTSHLIVLGGGELDPKAGIHEAGTVEWFFRRLELPVHVRLPAGGDEEFDMEFVVTTDGEGQPTYRGEEEEVHRPRFLRNAVDPDLPRALVDGTPQLEYDIALLVRKANPLNLSSSITMCTGIFSRGAYGAVRVFTDASLRARNEQFLAKNFAAVNDFWLLLQVPVYGAAKTVTPDLERAFLRLRSSESS